MGSECCSARRRMIHLESTYLRQAPLDFMDQSKASAFEDTPN